MPRASFHTVGCKLNTCESEILQHQFVRAGYEVVEFGEEADVTVINTCTLTDRSDSDCRKTIRRARKMSKDARIVVTGCMAERVSGEIASMPEVALVVGNREKSALVRHVSDLTAGRTTARVILDAPEEPAPAFLTIAPTLKIDAEKARTNTRATLQVQDGCDEHCTYCIIPSVRGASRSRPLEEIVLQARALVLAGYREIALTGVNTGAWGEDLGGSRTLIDVIWAILAVPGVERLRLNSLEPTAVTRELVDFVAETPRICRHFHIPLQSGSDAVLKRMNRRYRAEEYARIVELLAERAPGCALGADVMVGFPGETEEQFAETYRLLERLPVTYLHVFAYSEREGTHAMKLPGHCAREVKERRSRDLRRLSLGKRLEFHRRHVGETVRVLLESSRDRERGWLRGLTDNYIRVSVDAPEALINHLVPLRLTKATPEGADGVLSDVFDPASARLPVEDTCIT